MDRPSLVFAVIIVHIQFAAISSHDVRVTLIQDALGNHPTDQESSDRILCIKVQPGRAHFHTSQSLFSNFTDCQ